jgi:hypothetical protein
MATPKNHGVLMIQVRVIAAPDQIQQCKRQLAAVHFAVGISTVINWVRRFRETGGVLPGKMGGHKPKAIIGERRTWLLLRIKEKDFTLRGHFPSLPAVFLDTLAPIVRTAREAATMANDARL